ncbi:MAG: hypothetical protein ACREHE_01505 [Rhizomicrobium sp.]
MRLLCAALPLLLLAGAASAASPWTTFNDPDGVFRVSMPSAPKTQTDSVTNTDGTPVGMMEYVIDRGDNAMLVIISDLTRYPDADHDKVIAGAVDGAQKSAKLVQQTATRLDGQSGQEVILNDASGNTIDDRIFFVHGKLYQVMYVLPPKAAPVLVADVKRYTRSFHFVRH